MKWDLVYIFLYNPSLSLELDGGAWVAAVLPLHGSSPTLTSASASPCFLRATSASKLARREACDTIHAIRQRAQKYKQQIYTEILHETAVEKYLAT